MSAYEEQVINWLRNINQNTSNIDSTLNNIFDLLNSYLVPLLGIIIIILILSYCVKSL